MTTEAGPVARLTWEQAFAWRMQRHHLVERATPEDLLRVTSDICGLHAQLMSSAELSLWARVDEQARDAVASALWRQRTLVKLWAMRGTLHLLPSDELGLWVAAFSTYTDRGMTNHPEIDALIDAVARALDGRDLTREELAQAIEQGTGDAILAEYVRFSWGSYLKPGAFRGLLLFAEGEGKLARFSTPARWLGHELKRPEPGEALREVTCRYLAAYAPARAEDLALWWGGYGPARGRRMLASLGDEVAAIEIDGDSFSVLARDVDDIQSARSLNVARLLPAFDPWVAAASRDGEAVIDLAHRARVYRPQGWISPVVLVNGRIVGVWKHERKGRRLRVAIEPFGPLPGWTRDQLDAEVERLHAFLGGELALEWVA